jgi:hypothetical protein
VDHREILGTQTGEVTHPLLDLLAWKEKWFYVDEHFHMYTIIYICNAYYNLHFLPCRQDWNMGA